MTFLLKWRNTDQLNILPQTLIRKDFTFLQGKRKGKDFFLSIHDYLSAIIVFFDQFVLYLKHEKSISINSPATISLQFFANYKTKNIKCRKIKVKESKFFKNPDSYIVMYYLSDSIEKLTSDPLK